MSHNMNHNRDLNGILIINKPKSWTSFDVVAKIRNKLNVKKVGHTGTLDPMATGVLVLCLGKATKMAQEITGKDKEYIAEITLGATSNTDDAEGTIISNVQFPTLPTGHAFQSLVRRTGRQVSNDKALSLKNIQEVLKQFQGTFEQMPPQFSAKKINGQRAYKLARKGKKVELKPVEITIHELKLLAYKWPLVRVRALCTKGTYIRSLARDIGKELGVGGYLSKLERTKVGNYSINQSVSIKEAEEKHVLPI